jgi:UDP-N-acetylmuramyl pentapeptide synthase
MLKICIAQLAELVDGRLQLASMPPLGGGYEPAGRIVIDSNMVLPGDIYWALDGFGHQGSSYTQQAFAHGAQGCVVAGRGIEPWAGRFCIEVADSKRAFCYFARCLEGAFVKNSSPVSLGVHNEIFLLKAIAAGDISVLEDLIHQQARRTTVLAA